MTQLDLMFPREVTNMWTTPTATWIKWIELQTLASTTPTSSILLVCSFNSFFIFLSPHLCHFFNTGKTSSILLVCSFNQPTPSILFVSPVSPYQQKTKVCLKICHSMNLLFLMANLWNSKWNLPLLKARWKLLSLPCHSSYWASEG